MASTVGDDEDKDLSDQKDFGRYQRRYSLAGDHADALAALWAAVDESDALEVSAAVRKCKDLRINIDEERKSDGVTPLAVAVKRGSVAVANILIKNGAVADRALDDGSTLLWMASKIGNIDIIKVLAEAGAKVDRPKKTTGATPLIAACRAGKKTTAALLLELGADPRARAMDGSDSLYVAAQGDFVEILELLVGKGADVHAAKNTGATALFIAAQKGRAAAVSHLLKLGARPDVATKDGASAVVVAAQNGHLGVVKELVTNGADVCKPWKHGVTALFLAAQEGHADMVRCLVKDLGHAVSPAEARNGFTPLFAAAQRGHVGVLRVLVEECGAAVDQGSIPGFTPQMVAAQSGQAGAVEWLLTHGADPLKATPLGATSLFLAAAAGHVKVVEVIVFAGCKAAPKIPGARAPMPAAAAAAAAGGGSGLGGALTRGEARSLTLPLIDRPRKDGTSPAHAACSGGHYDVLDVLGQKGADLAACDDAGLHPWHAAAASPFPRHTHAALEAHGVREPGLTAAFLRCCGCTEPITLETRSVPRRSHAETVEGTGQGKEAAHEAAAAAAAMQRS